MYYSIRLCCHMVGTFGNFWEPVGNLGNLWEPVGNLWELWEPWEPLGTFGNYHKRV